MLRRVIKSEPPFEMSARRAQFSAMEPTVANRPMTGHQGSRIVLSSGQIEQFFGDAMRSVGFGAHVVMHELAPQSLEQVRRVVQQIAETARPRVGLSSLFSRMALRGDQRAAERELKSDFNSRSAVSGRWDRRSSALRICLIAS